MILTENRIFTMGADISGGGGECVLDGPPPDSTDYFLLKVDKKGAVLPYGRQKFPKQVIRDLGVEGISAGGKKIKPGNTGVIELHGDKFIIYANDKKGITLNGNEATVWSQELDEKRYP